MFALIYLHWSFFPLASLKKTASLLPNDFFVFGKNCLFLFFIFALELERYSKSCWMFFVTNKVRSVGEGSHEGSC